MGRSLRSWPGPDSSRSEQEPTSSADTGDRINRSVSWGRILLGATLAILLFERCGRDDSSTAPVGISNKIPAATAEPLDYHTD